LARSCSRSGRGLLGRSLGWGRVVGRCDLVVRCGRWAWPAAAGAAIEVMTTARPKHGWSGAPTFPFAVMPCPAPTRGGIGGLGARLVRGVLGQVRRRLPEVQVVMFSAAESDGMAMIAGRAGTGAVVSPRGTSAQQVCAAVVAAWSQPSSPAPPDRSWPLSGEGSNPAACWLAVRGRSGACRVTCGACAPVVPAGARCGSGGFGAARTGDHDHGLAPVPSVRGRRRRPGSPRPGTERSAVSGWPCLPGGLGGAGRWSAVAASRPGLRKVRLCEGGLVAIPQIRY
jgi:hypothetical protein